MDSQQFQFFIGDVFGITAAANFLLQCAGVAQPVAFGIILAQLADRRQRLGLVARLIQGISLPVHRAVGLASVDFYHFIKLLDGAVVLTIVERVLGGRIQLVFMRVGFLRGLRVQQGRGRDLLRRGDRSPSGKSGESKR